MTDDKPADGGTSPFPAVPAAPQPDAPAEPTLGPGTLQGTPADDSAAELARSNRSKLFENKV